jgi:hypothetical protein
VAQATTIHGELGVGATMSDSITDTAAHLATALTTANASLATVEGSSSITVTDLAANLTVNAQQFGNLLAGVTVLSANDTITIDGVNANVNLGTLDAFGGNLASLTGMTLGGASNGSYTVNMGTSGETGIVMEGTGAQNITASLGTLEVFTVGLTNHGGSTISNLGINDSVDVTGAANPSLTTQVAAGNQVTGPGQWAFAGGVLTWWDPSTSVADHLTLQLATGAHGVALDNGRHSFTVI